MLKIAIHAQTYPLKTAFRIARGEKQHAHVVMVELTDGAYKGRGEAVPYARYGETIETVTAAIEAIAPAIKKGMTRADMQHALLPGAARTALDCAFWDLQAKRAHQPVWELAGLPPPQPVKTLFTISLDTPVAMAHAAKQAQHYDTLKIKLGSMAGSAEGIAQDIACLTAIRDAVPDKQLIVDVNEGWRGRGLAPYVDLLRGFDILFFEQPFPAGQDTGLAAFDLPFCADESLHESSDLEKIDPAYSWINIKIDKAGGLTEALSLLQMGKAQDKKIMLGCMVASSLSMAPAMLLAGQADCVDLDAPLWLAQDCPHGLTYEQQIIHPPTPALWG